MKGPGMIYRHGGDVYRNRNVELDFSINLNPLGMPDFIRQAAVDSLRFCERYPDSECARLRAYAAREYAVPEQTILFGNGASDLIFRIVRAKRPKRAAVLAPSFLEYEAALKSVGAEICFFYLKEELGFLLPVEEYLDFLSRTKPDLVFLCNPDNPGGNGTGPEAMERILDFCGKAGVLAVVDECFLDFLADGEEMSCLGRIRNGHGGLFILQALTKSFSMAGLRLGYGFVADRELAAVMKEGCQPWSVSIPAQAAGCAAFGPGRKEFLKETREAVRREREVLSAALLSHGFKVYGSKANFLFFRDVSGKDEGALYEFFLDHGILIRSCMNYEGLNGFYYRICVRDHASNQKLIDILDGYL